MVRRTLSQPQHRNTAFLFLNMGAQAAAGLLFWLVLTRGLHLDAATIGVGYSVIALGTIAAVVAKGGLDTAILRHAPSTGRRGADGLLRLGIAVGSGVALLSCLVMAATGAWPELAWADWGLAAAIAVLLVAMWLQDALFLAEGRVGSSALRNLAASVARVLLPLLLIALAVPRLVAVAWALSLVGAAAVGWAMVLRLPHREGPAAQKRAFLASAGRNVAGGAAEFLPGLLLAPLVLATSGADAAAHFGMAWTIAAMLFTASSAASRSALATLVKEPTRVPLAIRRAALQHAALIAPAALGLIALSPFVLRVFGDSYAREASVALALLAISIVFVAPATLYLSLLRARDAGRALVAYPLALLAALAILSPILAARWGVTGVAAAWLLANLPFGLWAAWRLWAECKGVTNGSALVGGRAHLE
jgi:O-antigen/teichoic acid export membrane protein